MKLEKDRRFGFYYCPKCGLPLIYDAIDMEYVCQGHYFGINVHGCGFKISIGDFEE